MILLQVTYSYENGKFQIKNNKRPSCCQNLV